jgi:HEPN domain-containing protein
MTNHASAGEILAYARQILETNMRGMQRSGSHNGVVRSAQEAFELLLKAATRELGGDYPKVHDPAAGFVALALHAGVAVAPEDARRMMDESRWLAEQRGPAFYLERKYSADEAARAASAAEWALQFVETRIFRK